MKNYSGYDLILLKLYPEDIKTKGVFVPVKPLCMPKDENGGMNQKKFIMNWFTNIFCFCFLENLFTTGFGKRRFPHCLTDNQGPEKFGLCGRPLECSKDHRATKCGLEFLYKGKKHKNCLDVPNPSSKV